MTGTNGRRGGTNVVSAAPDDRRFNDLPPSAMLIPPTSLLRHARRAARVLRRTLLCALLAGEVPAQSTPSTPDAAPAPRQLTVRVVTSPEAAPLGYSVVSVAALGIERFSNSVGVVVLPIPTPGRIALRVKRLGFTPLDTSIVVSGAAYQTVVVALKRVEFKLEAVTVVAWPPCKRPGVPRRGGDARVRTVIEQIRQNAERYRLLLKSYPFNYASLREMGAREPDGVEVIQSSDTILVDGRPRWTYRPGTLIAREDVRFVRRNAPNASEWVMRIPSIGDLAEDVFIDNHCFHVAGLEEKEGQQLLRIDIVAAERLRSADVNVVAWLDPRDFQLRYATFVLSRIPRQFTGLLQSSNKVTYVELIPFVPVMQLMLAENLVQFDGPPKSTRTFIERQRILQLAFLGEKPEGLPSDSTGAR